MIAGRRDGRRHMFIRGKGGTVKNNDSEVTHEKEHCGERQQVISTQRED